MERQLIFIFILVLLVVSIANAVLLYKSEVEKIERTVKIIEKDDAITIMSDIQSIKDKMEEYLSTVAKTTGVKKIEILDKEGNLLVQDGLNQPIRFYTLSRYIESDKTGTKLTIRVSDDINVAPFLISMLGLILATWVAITAVRILSKKLKTAQAQLLQADKLASLGQLVAGVAHEINNPLAAVISYLSGLEEDMRRIKAVLLKYREAKNRLKIERRQFNEVDQTENGLKVDIAINDLDDAIKRMSYGLHRIEKVVQDLRTFSHLDQAEIKKTPLHDLLNSTISIFETQYKGRIKIHKEYSNLPDVECYPGQLNQVFMNLLVNAAQAIPENGDIWVQTSATDQQEVRVSVRDNGTGIPEDILGKIFDPFFTTKDPGVGTGLGLAISHSILERHHGRIEVESKPGKGSVFTVILPVRLKDKI
jgi:signal transduction histidine kinase